MSVRHAIGVFDYQTKTFTLIAGSTSYGFRDGQFSNVKFNYPVALIFLDIHTLLVSDQYNHRLRVLELTTNLSISICSGEYSLADGNFSSCSLRYPVGLLVIGDKIYVGDYQRIRIKEGMYGFFTFILS